MHVQILDNASDRNIVRGGIPYAEAAAYLDSMTGRNVGAYILGACRANGKRTGRSTTYVAANRNSPWHTTYGSLGFIAEVVA